ncbi:MAG: DUF2270 domain-containing protein [Armatimonadetes bacterium]|nr:DUF2270 domain-containing protein [Armatimonadota bacterium]
MDADKKPEEEPVWTYRGYQLGHGDFNTAMVHLFRAEVTRANVWRQRLDSTTNWAVITTGAAISIAFSDTFMSHLVIVLNTLMITLFLAIEARRYRYYELWSYRVRLMETDFFASMLVPPFKPSGDWAESLAENLLHPHFPVSFWEAFGRRYRFNYVYMYAIMALAWGLKVWIHPHPSLDWHELMRRAAVGEVSGPVIAGCGLIFNGVLLLIGLATRGLHAAAGEVLPRYAAPAHTEPHKGVMRAWFRPSRPRKQWLALIISSRGKEVGTALLSEMRRGVTEIPATGMYTGQAKSMLLVALSVTEVPHLKAVIKDQDPRALMVIAPVAEVLGTGFLPLEEDDGREPDLPS